MFQGWLKISRTHKKLQTEALERSKRRILVCVTVWALALFLIFVCSESSHLDSFKCSGPIFKSLDEQSFNVASAATFFFLS